MAEKADGLQEQEMSEDKEAEFVERLVRIMIEEGRRFDAESAWIERQFPKDERERRQVKIILAEMRVAK